MDELKRKAIEAIEDCVKLGNSLFNCNMPTPKADFSITGRVGGKYSSSTHSVMVNPILFSENVIDYLQNAIPHEVAHAFQRHIYGHYKGFKRVMPHGVEWKNIMIALGKTPSRCHNYDTSNASSRTRNVARDYTYVCDCRTHHLTSIKHNRIQSNKSSYRCCFCKVTIKYNG